MEIWHEPEPAELFQQKEEEIHAEYKQCGISDDSVTQTEWETVILGLGTYNIYDPFEVLAVESAANMKASFQNSYAGIFLEHHLIRSAFEESFAGTIQLGDSAHLRNNNRSFCLLPIGETAMHNNGKPCHH